VSPSSILAVEVQPIDLTTALNLAGVQNPVPNASAAVFRKPSDIDFAEELATLRFAGDWFF
jgi:hypothetical protein